MLSGGPAWTSDATPPPNVCKRRHKNTDKASPSGTAQTPNSVRSINWPSSPAFDFWYSSLWSIFGFTGVVTKSCCSDRDVRRGRASAAILLARILAGSSGRQLPRPLLPPPAPRRWLHLRLPRRGRGRGAQHGNCAPLPGLIAAASWVGRNCWGLERLGSIDRSD